MLYNIVPLIIIVVSLSIILYIIVRKLPMVASIDVNSIPAHQQAKIKEKIIADRIKRRFSKISPRNLKFVYRIFIFLKNKIDFIYRNLLTLEKRYKFGKKNKKEVSIASIKKASDILEENIKKEDDFEETEKKYISAIKLDPQNKSGYLSLGDLYLKHKDYEQAMETFNYILKLDDREKLAYLGLADIAFFNSNYILARQNYKKFIELGGSGSRIFANLAESAEKIGNTSEALVCLKEAVNLLPNSPKYLDQLLGLCIIEKDKGLAEEVLNKLKSVNPENKKIKEYRKKILEI